MILFLNSIEDTSSYGNIVKGWDGFINSKTNKSSHTTQKRSRVQMKERIFSRSSVTAPGAHENSLGNPANLAWNLNTIAPFEKSFVNA